jgi:uncharacterized protein YqhQ
MLLYLPWNKIKKKVKIGVRVIILAVILFYILPKLLSQFWFMNQSEQKIKPNYLEKPLRVTNTIQRSG